MSLLKSGNVDPRANMDTDTLEEANQKILSPVAMPNGLSPGMKLGVLGIGLLAILTFSSLANSRNEAKQAAAEVAICHSRRAGTACRRYAKCGCSARRSRAATDAASGTTGIAAASPDTTACE